MRDVIDLHTHTIASGHAYSTIRENAMAAKKQGLELLGITEHGPAMEGSCKKIYFNNLDVIDRSDYEVPLLFGVELNILDPSGKVDLPESYLEKLDYAIASIHMACVKPTTVADHTNATIKAIENPYVQIIGHPDDGRFPLNYEEIVHAAKENHVLLELNNSSVRPNAFRVNARENLCEMLELCKKYQVEVVMSSDAHVDSQIGKHPYVQALINEIGFPESLVINDDPKRFFQYMRMNR